MVPIQKRLRSTAVDLGLKIRLAVNRIDSVHNLRIHNEFYGIRDFVENHRLVIMLSKSKRLLTSKKYNCLLECLKITNNIK